MKNPRLFLTRPELFCAANVNAVTHHHNGQSLIKNPIHGMSGWRNGTLLIYNNKWDKAGWYRERDYQMLKVIGTGNADWRVMPMSFYETYYVAPLPPEDTGHFNEPPRRNAPRDRDKLPYQPSWVWPSRPYISYR